MKFFKVNLGIFLVLFLLFCLAFLYGGMSIEVKKEYIEYEKLIKASILFLPPLFISFILTSIMLMIEKFLDFGMKVLDED